MPTITITITTNSQLPLTVVPIRGGEGGGEASKLGFEETALGALTPRDQGRNGLLALEHQCAAGDFGQRPETTPARIGNCKTRSVRLARPPSGGITHLGGRSFRRTRPRHRPPVAVPRKSANTASCAQSRSIRGTRPCPEGGRRRYSRDPRCICASTPG